MGANKYILGPSYCKKKSFSNHGMIEFVNGLELKYKTYQTNGTLIYENYKEKLLFTMKEFVSFGIGHQSMFIISNIFLE